MESTALLASEHGVEGAKGCWLAGNKSSFKRDDASDAPTCATRGVLQGVARLHDDNTPLVRERSITQLRLSSAEKGYCEMSDVFLPGVTGRASEVSLLSEKDSSEGSSNGEKSDDTGEEKLSPWVSFQEGKLRISAECYQVITSILIHIFILVLVETVFFFAYVTVKEHEAYDRNLQKTAYSATETVIVSLNGSAVGRQVLDALVTTGAIGEPDIDIAIPTYNASDLSSKRILTDMRSEDEDGKAGKTGEKKNKQYLLPRYKGVDATGPDRSGAGADDKNAMENDEDFGDDRIFDADDMRKFEEQLDSLAQGEDADPLTGGGTDEEAAFKLLEREELMASRLMKATRVSTKEAMKEYMARVKYDAKGQEEVRKSYNTDLMWKSIAFVIACPILTCTWILAVPHFSPSKVKDLDVQAIVRDNLILMCLLALFEFFFFTYFVSKYSVASSAETVDALLETSMGYLKSLREL